MTTPGTAGKRGPSVLVTDSRERPALARQASGRSPVASQTSPGRSRASTRLISVDSVLQYASEIPSGQARGPPGRRPTPAGVRRPAGPPPANTNFGLRMVPQNVPGRSTKVSEKLVLIPETVGEKDDEEEDGSEEAVEGEDRPMNDDEVDTLKKRGGLKGKSYAERLPKARRAEKLARVTAYCTAQGYKMKATAAFLREHHGARTKLYDDCLYTVYHLPLLPGSEGYRVRGSPVLKSPGGKAVLDEQIERNEGLDYHEGYFEDVATFGMREGEQSPRDESDEERAQRQKEDRRRTEARLMNRPVSPNRIAPDATQFGEMFVFSYGVVVFWNFTERQEKDILADLTFSGNNTGIALVSRPQEEADFETEEFHFEYNPQISRPRIFNDMITLRSGDHMIKLAMSHAIAQSTKLSFFEERMSQTMQDAQYVPKRLALTGKLGMSRTEIVKITGRLFKSRVDVNLSSNVLDVPNFFWDSEPTLHPLYFAIREYLEIGPRIKVLNERCRVFLDLAEILSDSIADTKMSTITWIIIVLIVISIAVTVTEVGIRFAILQKEKKAGGNGGGVNMSAAPVVKWERSMFSEADLGELCGMGIGGHALAEL